MAAVTKGGGPGASKQGKQAAKAGRAAHSGRLEPGCWRVLAAVLASDAVPPSHQLPAALVPAAAALLAQLSAAQQPAACEPAKAARLLAQAGCLLRLLGGKFSGSHRPPLEHATGLAEAALLGWQAAQAGFRGPAGLAEEEGLQEAWAAVAEGAVAILQVRHL